jgi:hypothetical protein
VLLRLAYLGVTNALAMLRLLPMGDRAKRAPSRDSAAAAHGQHGQTSAVRNHLEVAGDTMIIFLSVGRPCTVLSNGSWWDSVGHDQRS